MPTRLTTGWRVCIDYRRLNAVTRKDHFPLPSLDQLLERVSGHPFYCFLDGYSRYFQIEIVVEDQEKTTFTCPFGTYAYRRMPFGLCNAPATFQRCMLSIFSDMVERIMEVYMDDITIYGGIFEECLANLETVLNRCIEKNLVLNVETKLYDVISVCQTSDTATQELFSPQQRRQKLVQTIFHKHEKMDLFFFCKMIYLKFVCVVLITASAQDVQVLKVDI